MTTPQRKARWLWLPIAALLMSLTGAAPMQTDLTIHDPSTIVKRDKTYWVFGTGPGVPIFSSVDKTHWQAQGSVMPKPPAWIADAVPGNKNGFFWAPDIRRVGGQYLLYYSVSTFGSNVSAIGLATNKTLEPAKWADQGIVVQSQRSDNFNTIDPAVIQSDDGHLWLTFGSFWSGIKLVELDSKTGKRRFPDTPPLALAAHPQDRANSIEAPFIHFHKGYYYLFVNWDYCCRGERSTYNIRVGRAKKITGSYLDKSGVALTDGGGTPFLESDPNSDASPAARIGPGHAGIVSDGKSDWFSCHYEFVRDRNGAPTLTLFPLVWDKDGWPRVVPDVPAPPAK